MGRGDSISLTFKKKFGGAYGKNVVGNLTDLLASNADIVLTANMEESLTIRADALFEAFVSDAKDHMNEVGQVVYGYSIKGLAGTASCEVDLAGLFLASPPFTFAIKGTVRGERSDALLVVIQRLSKRHGLKIANPIVLMAMSGKCTKFKASLDTEFGLKAALPGLESEKEDGSLTSQAQSDSGGNASSDTTLMLESFATKLEAKLVAKAGAFYEFESFKARTDTPMCYDSYNNRGLRHTFNRILGPGTKSAIKDEALGAFDKLGTNVSQLFAKYKPSKGFFKKVSGGNVEFLDIRSKLQEASDDVKAALAQMDRPPAQRSGPLSALSKNQLLEGQSELEYHLSMIRWFQGDETKDDKGKVTGYTGGHDDEQVAQSISRWGDLRDKLGTATRLSAQSQGKTVGANIRDRKTLAIAARKRGCFFANSSHSTGGSVGVEAKAEASIAGQGAEVGAHAAFGGHLKWSGFRYQTVSMGRQLLSRDDIPLMMTQDTNILYKQTCVDVDANAAVSVLNKGKEVSAKELWKGKDGGSKSQKLSNKWYGLNSLSYTSSVVFWVHPLSRGASSVGALPGSGICAGESITWGAIKGLHDYVRRRIRVTDKRHAKYSKLLSSLTTKLNVHGLLHMRPFLSNAVNNIISSNPDDNDVFLIESALAWNLSDGASPAIEWSDDDGCYHLSKSEFSEHYRRGMLSRGRQDRPVQALRLRRRVYDALDDANTLFKCGFKLAGAFEIGIQLERVDRAGCSQTIDIHTEWFNKGGNSKPSEAFQVPSVALFHQ